VRETNLLNYRAHKEIGDWISSIDLIHLILANLRKREGGGEGAFWRYRISSRCRFLGSSPGGGDRREQDEGKEHPLLGTHDPRQGRLAAWSAHPRLLGTRAVHRRAAKRRYGDTLAMYMYIHACIVYPIWIRRPGTIQFSTLIGSLLRRLRSARGGGRRVSMRSVGNRSR